MMHFKCYLIEEQVRISHYILINDHNDEYKVLLKKNKHKFISRNG